MYRGSASRTLFICVDGVVANIGRCLKYAENSAALITVLAPAIGNDKAAKIAKKTLTEEKASEK